MEMIRRTQAEFAELCARRDTAIQCGLAALALLDDDGNGDEDAKRAAQKYAMEAAQLQNEIVRSLIECNHTGGVYQDAGYIYCEQCGTELRP